MEVRNCSRCGKVFTKVSSSSICSDCEKLEEEQFKMVKEYIEDHRECTLDEVVAETEVPMKRIVKFIREGRLEISPGMSGDFNCTSCGAPITRGRYCDKCLGKMKNELSSAFVDPAMNTVNVRTSGRMHISKKL